MVDVDVVGSDGVFCVVTLRGVEMMGMRWEERGGYMGKWQVVEVVVAVAIL